MASEQTEPMDQENLMTGMVVLSKLQLAAATIFQGLVAYGLALLMSSADLILVCYLMLVLNVLSGWVLMIRTRAKWDREKWFKTAMKLIWFPITILATTAMEDRYDIGLPLASVVAGFITIHDLKSLFSNVGELTGLDLLNALSTIDWKSFKRKP